MSNLIETTLKKFLALDLKEIGQKANLIIQDSKDQEMPDPKKVEEFVRYIPGFTIVDMINFSSYCLSFGNINPDNEQELEKLLFEWIKKIN